MPLHPPTPRIAAHVYSSFETLHGRGIMPKPTSPPTFYVYFRGHSILYAITTPINFNAEQGIHLLSIGNKALHL